MAEIIYGEETMLCSNAMTDKKTLRSYDLRPRNGSIVNKSSKQKSDPVPLSRYRRKNANARERRRMSDLNQAFKKLYLVLPGSNSTNLDYAFDSDKTSKISILKLAIDYISSLDALLQMDAGRGIKSLEGNENASETYNENRSSMDELSCSDSAESGLDQQDVISHLEPDMSFIDFDIQSVLRDCAPFDLF